MFIPDDKERGAVEMFRAVESDPNDLAMKRIHAYIWPPGPDGRSSTSVSVPMLRTLLRSIAASMTVSDPGDELPDDLEDAIDDLKKSREILMKEIEAPTDPEAVGVNPMLHATLVRNVKALLDASTHRIALQKHRMEINADRIRRGLPPLANPKTRSA